MPGSLPSSGVASLLRPFTSSTDTNTFGMSASVIGTLIDCCDDVSAKRLCVRTPSRSVVTSAVACSHGDLIMIRADSPGA